jgi:hypothetical protein
MNRVGIGLWVATAVLVAASTAVSAGRDVWSDIVLYGILPLTLATVGTLVLSRAPGNRIGWIFSLLAVYVAAAELAEGYGMLASDWSLPAGAVGTWVISWSWVGEIATWTVIAAVFPDGKLAGRGWRWVPATALAGFFLAVTGMAFGTTANATFESGVNPFLVDHPAVGFAFALGVVLLAIALLGAAVSLVVRLRRARGIERQQLKWFVFAACGLAVVTPFGVALWTTTPVAAVVVAVAANAVPLAAGIAILRHRLYDIDVVINRTLVYACLTASLAVVYLGLVLTFRVVLDPITGESDLAVAVSTLAVAALFRPLRSRIQAVVDRRFYRKHYDAVHTLDDFSGRLRDELDLDSLGAELRSVVHETMQPAHVTLWLRREP